MDQPVDNYCKCFVPPPKKNSLIENCNAGIRAIPSSPGGSTTAGGINSAILRYDGAPISEPTTNQTANPVVMNESDLHVSLASDANVFTKMPPKYSPSLILEQ